MNLYYRNLPYFQWLKFHFLNFQLAKFLSEMEWTKPFLQETLQIYYTFKHIANCIDPLFKMGKIFYAT